MSKGGEVGDDCHRETVTGHRSRGDRTRGSSVQSVVDQWRGLDLVDQTLEALLTRHDKGESSQMMTYADEII